MKLNVKKFKELRRLKKVTVDELSNIAGVSPGAIYQYQSGRSIPSQETLEKMATLLGVNSNDLLMEDELPENEKKWKDEAYKKLEIENERLWLVIQKLTGAEIFDMGKLLANGITTGCKVVPFSISNAKLSA